MTRWLPILVMMYMVAALAWWSVLLLQQNEQLYLLKTEKIHTSDGSKILETNYEKQRKMIMGEGLVFAISMVLGTYFIYKSNIREMNLSRRQSNFLLSVSHELKSPLTSINLGLETLKKRALSQEKIVEVADMALKESRRLENLISTILTAAKVEHGYVPKKEGLNLVDLINQLLNQYNSRYPDQPFFAGFKVDEAIVLASRQDIHSLLTNLLDNAIKYGKKGPINLILSEDQAFWKIELTDEGPGIPPDERGKVFEKFYRMGNEETRSSKGTGLGLYIVKKIVESHGGKIELTQNRPTGSKFVIHLPKISRNENSVG
jgi:signal transduction histidine kinase